MREIHLNVDLEEIGTDADGYYQELSEYKQLRSTKEICS